MRPWSINTTTRPSLARLACRLCSEGPQSNPERWTAEEPEVDPEVHAPHQHQHLCPFGRRQSCATCCRLRAEMSLSYMRLNDITCRSLYYTVVYSGYGCKGGKAHLAATLHARRGNGSG